MRARFAFVLLAATACAAPRDEDASGSSDVVGSMAGERCELVPIPLRINTDGGYLTRVYVDAEHEGTHGVFLFDTGSATTFFATPAGTPDPAPRSTGIKLGACVLDVMGRPYPNAESIDGLRAIGTIGADALLGGPSELDLSGKVLRRFGDDGPPADTATWPALPYDSVLGHILVRIRIEGGEPVRLIVDTGSNHTLLLGVAGRPEDTVVRTQDGVGNELELHLGTSMVDLGGGFVDRVPVYRAPSFPYFEQIVKQLGGDVKGLLGLTTLGPRRIIVDTARRELRFGP